MLPRLTARARRAAVALGLAASLVASLAACSGAPMRVTLLPDRNGEVGAVVVGNAHGQEQLAQGYGQVEVRADAAPRAVAAAPREDVESRHRALFDAQPGLPLSYVLNFRFDSMELTPESERLLPEVLEAVRARLPTEVTVFGHADASGAADYNLRLSEQRARAVAALLRRIDPELPMELDWFGDTSPLVPAPRGVPEPRNRRAEIQIL